MASSLSQNQLRELVLLRQIERERQLHSQLLLSRINAASTAGMSLPISPQAALDQILAEATTCSTRVSTNTNTNRMENQFLQRLLARPTPTATLPTTSRQTAPAPATSRDILTNTSSSLFPTRTNPRQFLPNITTALQNTENDIHNISLANMNIDSSQTALQALACAASSKAKARVHTTNNTNTTPRHNAKQKPPTAATSLTVHQDALEALMGAPPNKSYPKQKQNSK